MKILKYQKGKDNEYKIYTDKEIYRLYDDIIIKYELLLKKEISDKELDNILKENNLLNAYYMALKAINIKLRCEKEIRSLLKKKSFNNKEIDYALERLKKDGYLNNKVYIEAYIHDMLNLYIVGELKIKNDLINLGFDTKEIEIYLDKVDKSIYKDKIEKYINKKLKANKKSKKEFINKTLNELINKGFNKEDILIYLDNIEIIEDDREIEKIINRLYTKYINKYDINTTKLKIKSYLYNKGYSNVDMDLYIDN